MKHQNLNALLHTDNINTDASNTDLNNTLQSLTTLETIESLQQAYHEHTGTKRQDSINKLESHMAQKNVIKNSIFKDYSRDVTITRTRKTLHSMEIEARMHNGKNPYTNTAKSSIHDSKDSQTRQIGTIKQKKLVYVSVGDINGIGLELILRNHAEIATYCKPIYCIDFEILEHAANKLSFQIPNDMYIHPLNMQDIFEGEATIKPGQICAKSGLYSFKSFEIALELSIEHNACLVTLPIHKYAWQLAGIQYAGHTQYLRHRFQKEAIMMLGCKEMFVALYTDHIPLSKVASTIQKERLLQFFKDFYHAYSLLFMPTQEEQTLKNNTKHDLSSKSPHEIQPESLQNLSSNTLKQDLINAKLVKRLLYDEKNSIEQKEKLQDSMQHNLVSQDTRELKIAVLGLNPHAGDNGVLGHEDRIIDECIKIINEEIGSEVFIGTIAPDSAFIPHNRKQYKVFLAMYHDSGLAPLKALYFDKSINVSLNLPILRISPDHGTCFDKAYKMSNEISMESYLESFRFLYQANTQYYLEV
ncbi:4-hydroxythreonine-4-phosphate dehydrogenase PdxA [Helicobacter trogontum]|uniref:4-hydroxythreonine-4-phosphate dehydrogenase n=1 Tax=Helicobacter trogontum TaxID=50960 RepID=A0A4U8S9I6_9HELI|nr:4-hydroxythreonine-4-phosphate dehydrogenase PdxA [Helicobacter trogontum]TLD82477.1 4-hydroxythreonine-4-phosphate dehydrogenase [Helicobacter trogontum]